MSVRTGPAEPGQGRGREGRERRAGARLGSEELGLSCGERRLRGGQCGQLGQVDSCLAPTGLTKGCGAEGDSESCFRVCQGTGWCLNLREGKEVSQRAIFWSLAVKGTRQWGLLGWPPCWLLLLVSAIFLLFLAFFPCGLEDRMRE